MINNNHDEQDRSTAVVIEGIQHCFSRSVDSESLKIALEMLKSMKLPDSDINTLMFMFAASCSKHYKYGYVAAQNYITKKAT